LEKPGAVKLSEEEVKPIKEKYYKFNKRKYGGISRPQLQSSSGRF